MAHASFNSHFSCSYKSAIYPTNGIESNVGHKVTPCKLHGGSINFVTQI